MFYGSTTLVRPGSPHCRGFTITLRHTTFVSTPLDDRSVRRRDHYLTTYNTYNRQTSMPPAGFKPTIPATALPLQSAIFQMEKLVY